MAEDEGAVIRIALVPHGYEIDVFVGDADPKGDDPSAFVCRDFCGDVDTQAMATSLFLELKEKLQDRAFESRFPAENGD